MRSNLFCLNNRNTIPIPFQVNFYLTGDALFTLYDMRYHKLWRELLALNIINITIDSWDCELLGLNGIENNDLILDSEEYITFTNSSPYAFWQHLIEHISAKTWGEYFGFLEMKGPYMSRTNVDLLRALKTALKNDFSVDLYAYLDGIHLGHDCQKPSEFENIGEGLKAIQELAKKQGRESKMFACSRCGTARGYIKDKMVDTYHQSKDYIPSFLLCNLNRIIDRFEENHIILSPSSAHIQTSSNYLKEKIGNEEKNVQIPPILLLITHSPYGSEWTFGGLSFAMACANHEIPIDVLFIEDGTYILMGTHKVPEEEKLFNVQEIIEATYDMDFLQYYAYDPSLENRGISKPITLSGVEIISTEQLANLFELDFSLSAQSQKRIIIF